jgi:FMNH2-dependent dimethyl sulfone monooxygenase
MKIHFIAGRGGYPIAGSREQFVDGLKFVSDLGFDGTLVSWLQYVEGMEWFQKGIMPLAERPGLR